MAWQWMAWQCTARQWTAQRLGDGRLDGNSTPIEQPDGNRQLDGNGNERLGYGRLSNERRNGLAMDSLTATQWR
jgi:hypothetical protein